MPDTYLYTKQVLMACKAALAMWNGDACRLLSCLPVLGLAPVQAQNMELICGTLMFAECRTKQTYCQEGNNQGG